MKRILVSLICFLFVPAFASTACPVPSKYGPVNESVYMARNSNDLKIIYLGEPSSRLEKDNNFPDVKYVNSLTEVKAMNAKHRRISLWIAEEMQDYIFTDKNIEMIASFIDQGYVVIFLGVNDTNLLKKYFTNDPTRDAHSSESLTLIASSIAKDGDGDYIIAHLYSEEPTLKGITMDHLLAMSWVYGNAKNTYRRDFTTNSYQTLDSIGTQSFGFNWTTVNDPWTAVTGMEDMWIATDYGTTVEWRRGFHVNVGGDDFYALVFEHFMEPKISNLVNCYGSRRLRLHGNLDTVSQSNTLRDYYPYNNPQQNDLHFGISWYGGIPTISAGWTISYEDLTIDITGTGDSYRRVDLKFIYRRGRFSPTDYAKQPSRQAAAWVIRNNHPEDGYAVIHNVREATFDCYTIGSLWPISRTHSLNSYTFLFR